MQKTAKNNRYWVYGITRSKHHCCPDTLDNNGPAVKFYLWPSHYVKSNRNIK